MLLVYTTYSLSTEHPNTTITQNEATTATMQERDNSAVQTEATTKVQSNSTTIILAGSSTALPTAPESNISNKISQTTIIVVVTVLIIVLCLTAGVSVAVIIITVRIKRRSKKKSGSSNKNSHNHSHLNYSNEKSWVAGPNHFDTAIPLYEGIQLTPSTIQDEALPLGYDSVDTTTHNHVTPSTAITQQDINRSKIKSERMYSASHRPGKAKDEPLPPIPPYKVEDMYATHLEEPPPVPPQTTEMLYAAVRKKCKKSKDDHNYY